MNTRSKSQEALEATNSLSSLAHAVQPHALPILAPYCSMLTAFCVQSAGLVGSHEFRGFCLCLRFRLRVVLKELGDWYGGGTPSKSNPAFWTDGDVPWLSPKDMGSDVLQRTQDHVTRVAVSGSSTKLVPAGPSPSSPALAFWSAPCRSLLSPSLPPSTRT